ncbi:DEAD/DEAH box helicase family protein [Bradyrhizobium sp. HKCCYLS2038]|uniref:DEAD/DEAH box helicase n=1 Tax=Bradyrhizobium sp. HKCCYLS2038 TaxID=3420764 RepID=UPI003EBC10BD
MIQLRPHQIDAADAVEDAYRAGMMRPLVDSCVGSGKSLTMAELARRAWARGERTIICAHRESLVEQNAEACRKLGLQVGINAAKLGERTWRAPVISAMINSVYNSAQQFGPVANIFTDEAHLVPHSESGMYREFLRGFPNARKPGFSGTVFRLQGGSLVEGEGAPFERVVFAYSIIDGIRDGYLVPAYSAPASDKIDVSKLRKTAGEFTGASQDAQMLALMDSHIAQMMVGGADRRAWLIFEATQKAALAMTERLNAWGIPAACVIDKTRDRRAIYDAFNAGRLRALVNVEALTTGFDSQRIDLVCFRRRTMSLGLYIQMCLDAQTEILTERGWLRHNQMTDGDKVAGFDRETGAIEWCDILSRVERPLSGGERMYGIKSPHLDIRVTDQHDMLVRSMSRTTKRWTKEPAAQMAMRAGLSRIPVAGIQGACGTVLTDDELRFVGWYLTDGCINKKTNQLYIAQSDAKPAHCAEIRRVLQSCGLKFGECLIKRTGAQVHYAPSRHFTVSKGTPRGRDHHLRGWSHLEPWLDKSIGSPRFEMLTQRQLLVLLQAMWLGDGRSGSAFDYTLRTFDITFGDNRDAAERMQSLCVRRGFRCNMAVQRQKPSSWNANPKPQYMLHIKSVSTSTVAGFGVADGSISGKKSYKRSRFEEVPHVPGELVWCVETRLGTIVTRRNGKVAIVGNCGRGLRTIGGNLEASIRAGKSDCLFYDFAGVIDQHGPLDFIRPKETKVNLVSCEACDARVPSAAMRCWNCDEQMNKLCPACLVNIPKGTLDCPECGHDMRAGGGEPVQRGAKLLETPSGAALIAAFRPVSEKAGGWIPIRRAWEVDGRAIVADSNGDRWELPDVLAPHAADARWIRGEAGAVAGLLKPNGSSRNTVLQITAEGVVLPVPMPPKI